MPINELRSIATFVKTAELGSMRRAALAQGISPQAASQGLAQLEEHLGVRLFHRTTRSMALTDEGREFLEAVQPSVTGLQRALQLTRRTKDEVAGPLRIVGPRTGFLPILHPVLEEFCNLHPDVQPDVQIDDRKVNWVEDRVDVGFRMGVSAAEGVIARRLFTMQLIICASPAYIQAHGAPADLNALAVHRCSAFRHPVSGKVLPWYVKVGEDVVHHDVVPAVCTNLEEVELEMVLAGRAIGSLTGPMVAAHIRAGRLVPLFAQHVTDHLSFFVYYGSRASQPVRVKAFIDLAVARLLHNPAFELSENELVAAEGRGRRAIQRKR